MFHSHTMSPHRLHPHLFALTIGINKYRSPDITELLGAVADADSVRDFLVKQLGVPSSQIKNLRGSEATRSAILAEIEALSNNSKIRKGDPILIFYAGHGSSVNTPNSKRWNGGGTGKIQLMIPYDHYSSLKDANPEHGIPDRTLGVLLSHLADKKGDNIVRQTF